MNRQRLLDTLEAFAQCNDTPGEGVTRFSWSAADARAKTLLRTLCEKAGLQVSIDGIGNLRARLRGATAGPAVLVGSHLDSVRHGGSLDGIYGVCAGLEALRTFVDEGFEPACDVELIAFAEEEGSNFGCTCLGSKAVTGVMDVAALHALHDDTSSAYARLCAAGLSPDDLPEQQIDAAYARAYLELHIEQNARLEQQGVTLGIVTAICGMRLHRIRFTGVSDHAASPMQGRRDAMAAFADFARRMEQLWIDGELPEDFSCTVGSLHCVPDVPIVIPESVTFTVDIRHVDEPTLEKGWSRIEELLQKVAQERSIAMTVQRLSASGGGRMDPDIMALFRTVAAAQGVSCTDLISGPAHDAACLARRVPTGLLFVPSIGGLSHCPQEATQPEHLAQGALVLEGALRELLVNRS
ncbi:MAG TPA: M20 family metallo-hydrolase [Candidatus Avidesulfovibrio excrementigallinarum]|nr:M20 family metallo-hydrolase [Candidatus Avidesulfovibrio excrementigallinarum]